MAKYCHSQFLLVKRLRFSASIKTHFTNPTPSPFPFQKSLTFRVSKTVSRMAQMDAQNGSSKKSVAFTAVKPQLYVEAPKTEEAVKFYKAAFGAAETGRTTLPKRKGDQEQPHVVSAQLLLASSTFLVSDSSDDATVKGGGSGVSFCLETEDVGAAVAQAVAAGAVAEGEITEGEGACGGRVGKVKDPYGFVWSICESSKKCRADVEA